MDTSILKVGMLDKQIMSHIRMNGTMFDEVGKELVLKLVRGALSNPTIKDAARQYNFTLHDLCLTYVAMVESLRPNPTIMAGTPMLAASLPFMEPFRIEQFMGTVHQQTVPGMPLEARHRLIVESATALAEEIWQTHTAARGEPPFAIDPNGTGRRTSGCLSAIVLIALAPIGYCATQFLFG